jgi:hypothetical protein
MQRGPQPHGRTTGSQRLEYPGEGQWDCLQHRTYGTPQTFQTGLLPNDPRGIVQGLTGDAQPLSEQLAQGGHLINAQ